MWFVYLFGLTVFLIYIWFKRQFRFWERHGFPFVPATIPFGSAKDVGFKVHTSEFFQREYEKFKNKTPAFGVYFLTQPVLIPTDPDLIKEILVSSFETFHDHGFVVNEKADPLSINLFFTSGQVWKDLRGKLSPTFTSGKMKMMFPSVASHADEMIKYLKPYADSKESLEMKEIYASFTTEVISDVAFGLETKCFGNPENEFRKMGRAVFEVSVWERMKIFFLQALPKIGVLLNIGFNRQDTTDFFMKVVGDTFNYREKNNVQRNDFFQLLMNLRNSSSGLTFNEMAANSFIFFLAGFETSSSTMTFFTYELALNPAIQERLRDEINETLAKHDNQVTYDAIMEMKYLDRVFNETLRKYPVADFNSRKSSKNFKIPNSDLVIPANTQIMIPSYAIQRDERFYENPEKFDPDRFTYENVQKRKPYTYLPFSEGPRICIGMRFGIMQTKIGIVKLLRNYRLGICSKTPIPIKFMPSGNVLSPMNGMWLNVENIERK